MKLSRLLLIAGLFSLAVGPVLADQSTGRVTVRVLDETGAPFPGVVVTLANSRNLQPAVALSTNLEGKVVFGVVQAGQGYRIIIEMAGFAKVEDGGLTVSGGGEVSRLYKLTPEIVEKVEVEGNRPIASLDEPTGTTSISGEFFEDLPILGRSYQSALTLAPGVQDSDEDGNPNVHGSRERDFKATVDGISNVDPLTGTFMSNINPDAIEEIQVVTTGADASYGRAVGGFAKIITKQGSNDFEGVAKFYYRTSKLDRNGAGSGDISDFDLIHPAISLTGKIITDKLFFALNHQYRDADFPVNLVGGNPLVINLKRWEHLDKITWQVTPRNKLNFQYSADPYELGPLGIDSLTDPVSGFQYEQGGPTYSLTWQSPVSPNFNITTVAGFSDTGLKRTPLTQGIANDCVVDPLRDLRDPISLKPLRKPSIDLDYCFEERSGRTSGSYFFNYDDDRQRLTIKSDATLYLSNFLGKEHTLDFGIIAEDEHYEAQSLYGPFSLLQTTANRGGIFDPEGEQTSAALLNRTIFAPGAPTPFQGEADGLTLGVYLQDSFRPHPRVLIKAGLRLEREHVEADGFQPVDPASEFRKFDTAYNLCYDPERDPRTLAQTCTKLSFQNFTSYENLPCPGHPLCQTIEGNTGVDVRAKDRIDITNYNLSPKLSVSWDPKGDGRTKVFGTFSRGYDKIFLAVPVSEQGPFVFNQVYETTVEDIIDPETFLPIGKVVKVSDFPQAQSAPSISQVDRNLRTPFVDEYTLGFTREIAPETGLTVTYIRRRYKDQFQDIDINHKAEDLGDNDLDCFYDEVTDQFFAQGKPDGEFDDCGGSFTFRQKPGAFGGFELFEVPDGIPDLRLRSPMFNELFLIGNFNRTDYTAYEVELVRRLHHNWEMEASYVWSKAVGQAEDFNQGLGDDPTTVQDEKGFLSFDQRHVVKFNARTLLPLWDLRLGAVARWESGQPYSTILVRSSRDRTTSFGTFRASYNQARTTFPSRQRNDQRNESFYTLDVNAQKDFQIGKVNLTAAAEIFNLLNDDRLAVAVVRNGRVASERRFGRRFQMSVKVNF